MAQPRSMPGCLDIETESQYRDAVTFGAMPHEPRKSTPANCFHSPSIAATKHGPPRSRPDQLRKVE
ncbi:hypothetical protein B7486_10030 [cyanobacterium TDX16]|nr:hypothetical protein B7486_10030 [cyanobacterium TDX16]